MQVRLQRVNNQVHFVAENADGNRVHIDGSPAVGGQADGFRPMELLLAAVAGCASMDLVPILNKQRQHLDDISIVVDGRRAEGRTPAPFEQIDISFVLTGRIDQRSAERAAALAVEKYCSVAESLAPAVQINWSVVIDEAGEAEQHGARGHNSD